MRARGRQLLLALLLATATPLAAARQDEGSGGAEGTGEETAEATAEPTAPPPVTPEQLEGAHATLFVLPTEAEVGEPLTFTLEVVHPRELPPFLPEGDLGLGDDFLVLEESGAVTLPVDEGAPDGPQVTRKSWSVAALTPVRGLPSMELFFDEESAGASVLTNEVDLTVRTLLGAGDPAEHGIRPSLDFREVLADEPAPTGLPWWAYAAAVPVVLGLGALLARRRQRPAPERPVPPLERLDALATAVPADLPALQDLHYSLSALVREAVDARTGKNRAALTDEEWLRATTEDGALDDPSREALADVLARASEVKFARRKPTKFAVDETLGVARGVLERLGGAA